MVDSSPDAAVIQTYGPIENWCVGALNDFYRVFSGTRNPALRDFNEDINGWDLSGAMSTAYMFEYARSFNQDLDAWDVSSVTNMEAMFRDADMFNGEVGSWNVSAVQNMKQMFAGAFETTGQAFSGDLSNWDVSSVTDFTEMFQPKLCV